MQLDLFEHSADVALRNGVLDALQQRDASAASEAWLALAERFAQDPALPALAELVGCLEAGRGAAFGDHDALARARADVETRLGAAASAAFGAAGGRVWLVPHWGDLAERAAALAFRGDRSDDHAAPLRLRAGAWTAAAAATAAIASWRRIPAPLGWMTEARYRLDGLDAVWPLLVELAWIAPARFDALTRRLADSLLDRLRKQFDAAFEGDGTLHDLAWMPAWLLTEKPALAARFGQAQPSRDAAPERAAGLLMQLLQLERQGRHRDLIERRKALHELHPFLYGLYMKSR